MTPASRDARAALAEADRLHAAGRLDGAIDAYRRAVALDDRIAEAWYGLGCAEAARDGDAAAAEALARAVALRPGWGEAGHNLGNALFRIGDIDAALAAFRAVARLGNPAVERAARAAIATIIPGCAGADHAAVLHARRAFAAGQTPAPRPAARARRPGERLRLGYVSSHFDRRNWMKPVVGVLNRHDRARFELHLFCDGGLPSEDDGFRLHDRDYVHDVRGAPNDGLADYIRRAGIDLLIDLNGYSAAARLGLYALRPAPVIAGWFNLYATSGLPAIDYIIGDAAVIDPAEEPFYSERVLRVPGSYLAFTVAYPVPEVVPPPCLGGPGLTFGCFGSQYKVTAEVVAAWCEILQRAPGARLLIKNKALGNAANRAAMRARFDRAGIAPERVALSGPDEHFQFLAAYGRVDVVLDTFPYNGGTTTMEALWQGVPVLAFRGDRWAGRTSCSLLRAAGLGDWCVADRAAYVERAVALAQSPSAPRELAALRAAMRSRLAASRACDSAGLCRSLERLYRTIAGAAPPSA